MMARILVMIFVAKLRIGTGQGVVNLLQFVGFTVGYFAHRIPSIHLHVLDTIHGIAHTHRTAQANALRFACCLQ
jgi:ABC-type uncharacterized transport system permease subunit